MPSRRSMQIKMTGRRTAAAWVWLVMALVGLFAGALVGAEHALAADPAVLSIIPPVTWVESTGVITPGAGTGGFDADTSNFKPYRLPGQNEDPVGPGNFSPGEPLIISYAQGVGQPVQTNDWWTSMGLQQSGWVSGRGPDENEVAQTVSFVSEPFLFQFVDFGDELFSPPEAPQSVTPPHGLRLWNQNTISVSTSGTQPGGFGYDPSLNFAGRGEIAPAHQGALTVGLNGVHPLKQGVPTSPPWTNVLVQKYSDWGVTVSYTDNGNQLQITMANGSPFVWFERSSTSTAPFTVWAGGSPQQTGGSVTQLFQEGSMLGLEITTTYNPYKGLPQASSTAIYVLYADKGNWTRTTTNGTLALYSNPAAGTVIVLAMPHNITAANAKAAARNLEPYACNKTVATWLAYPPNSTSAVVGDQTVSLGYDPANSLVRSQLVVVTQRLAGFSCRNGLFVSILPALQMVFPHHLKAMPAAQKKQIIRTPDQLAYKYIWNTLLGPAYGYQGNSIVQELPTYGVLPFLPDAAISLNVQNPLVPGQSAAEDLYATMKNWFFVEEPIKGNSHLNSFTRNIGNYVNAATNTYIPGTTTLREGIIIADQLAQSSALDVTDPQLGKSKRAVSSEIRDELLQSLKEIIGQWADIYTSQLFQYNPAINSIYGYPAGYGAVGSINDHHFHYGYFLRAAAAIGRYDKAWLQSYLPLLNELRMDVANFDRSSTRYPVLRNFNPFYGHSWADGKAYNQNQESSSEAINFAVGLIELGELLNKKDWRDLGLYLYEQEILATNQYYFNQDATLAATPPTPPYSPLRYNGNWPEQFVTYTGPDGTTWHTTLLGRLFPLQLDRGTFFGPIDTTYAIQQVPLDASALYFGRNQNWLAATWEQYKLDTGIVPVLSGVYENIVSSMQARLPASGSDVNGTGLTPALTRINTLHQFFPGAVNTAAKHWAYTNATLGQVDTSVVADIPDYAVFSANGTQTFVAYNPTNADVSVTFKVKATGAVAAVVSVPANSMVTQVQGGSSPIVDRLSLFDPNPPGRLYLRSEGVLNPQPGTWMLPTPGTSPPFPTDTSAIQASLLTVPVRGDGGQPPVPPAPAKILTWKGHFSGNLVGTTGPNDPNCQPPPGFTKPGCDPAKTLQAVTHMAIYTDQCLYPGWQRCQKTETDGNTITARVSYYFDTATCDPVKGDTCTADRVETYGNVALQARDNTFIGNNKITEYYFAGVNLAKPDALLTSGFNGSFGLNIVLPPASCTPSPCGFFSANGIPIPPGGVFPQQGESRGIGLGALERYSGGYKHYETGAGIGGCVTVAQSGIVDQAALQLR